MAQLTLSGLVRTSDLPVAAKTGSPARRRLGVMSRQLPRCDRWTVGWTRDSVEACCVPLRAAARGGCARCPKRCATKRRFSTESLLLPTSPPPSPGCRPQDPPSWAPWESMGLMMAGGRQATGGDAASSVAAPSPTALRRPSRGSGRRGRARAARLQGRDSLRARFSRDRGRRRGVATATRPPSRRVGGRAASWPQCHRTSAPVARPGTLRVLLALPGPPYSPIVVGPKLSRAHPRRRSESFRDDPSRFKSDRQIAPLC